MLKFVVDVIRAAMSPEEMKLLEKTLRAVFLHMPSVNHLGPESPGKFV